MKKSSFSFPVLSCDQSRRLESSLLKDEASEWLAMQRAGFVLAKLIIQDYKELHEVPPDLRIVALIGKGHNGGDAMLACRQFLEDFPQARIVLLLACDVPEMKSLSSRAYEQIKGRVVVHSVAAKVDVLSIQDLLDQASMGEGFDLCLDGLLGTDFMPPVREPVRALIQAVNGYEKICLRAAVDLPSGQGDSCDAISFHPDFTYATGTPKAVQYTASNHSSRVRFIDLGFFEEEPSIQGSDFLLNSNILKPLRKFRPAQVDKRSFGHLYIIGGSAHMPGALLMSVQAAVRSGVGRVTVFAPASVTPVFAAQVPEAMWISWPETDKGVLDSRAMPRLIETLGKATTVLVGPGMGDNRDAGRIAQKVISKVKAPVVCDADALQRQVVELVSKRKVGSGPVILTPHMGEYKRIAKFDHFDYSNGALKQFSKNQRVISVLKGPITRICDGEIVLLSGYGGPVLSRGGSGDILAGLIGGMLASHSAQGIEAVARAVVLHGLAAERLARSYGQVAVQTTQILDFLPEVLRSPEPFELAIK